MLKVRSERLYCYSSLRHYLTSQPFFKGRLKKEKEKIFLFMEKEEKMKHGPSQQQHAATSKAYTLHLFAVRALTAQ